MRVSPTPSREAGFTLVEVMVAALVLVIGIAATLSIFASAQSSSMTSQRNEIAVREAENQLEGMRGQCYGALTMATAHPAASADADDPLTKVAAGRLTVKTGLTEDVVSERVDKEADDDCTDSDGDGKVDPAVVPMSNITIGSGATAVTGKVYRFVSWRDEECPIVNLTNLQGIVTDLQTITTTLAADPNGTLDSLVGDNGSLIRLIDSTGDVAGTPSALQMLLYPILRTLRDTLNPLLANQLQPLLATLTPMLAPLQATLAPLQQLTDLVTQHLDLCDLPALLDLSSLSTLEAALNDINGAVAALAAPIAALRSIIDPLVNLEFGLFVLGAVDAVGTLPAAVLNLTTAVTSLNDDLEAVKDDAANGQTRITELAETVTTAVSTLVAQPDTTHNTKRLTVAIWLDSKANSGLRKPFYATSVVSDPKDGLL